MAKNAFSACDPDLASRAEQAIAHGALTNSKRPSCFVSGVYPTHLARGSGCYVWDTKGNKYIDFICGLGSNLLGYANEEINQAISDQLKKGASLSLSSTLEVEVAEKVKELFPFIETLRFLKTGSDACSAAIRIARARTGQIPIYTDGYHGWHDEWTSLTPPALGVPPQSNITAGTHPPAGTAACIIEPILTDFSPERKAAVQKIAKRCKETGTLLIFDEVITGLRTPGYSASASFDVIPDLICLGKALGNGMPISVVGGKRSIMDSDYFVSSTFAGETLSLSSALKTMNLLQQKFKVDTLWDKGAVFLREFNALWKEGVWIEGYPTRGAFKGNPDNVALFWQEACKSGLLFGPSWFFCFPHIDVMDQVLSTCKNILGRVRRGEVKLEGETPKKAYAQIVRETMR